MGAARKETEGWGGPPIGLKTYGLQSTLKWNRLTIPFSVSQMSSLRWFNPAALRGYFFAVGIAAVAVAQGVAPVAGTMPEDLPTPETSVKKLEREKKRPEGGDE